MEVYGSEGTLIVPDPNYFSGPVKLRKKDEEEFAEVPLLHGYEQNSRGLGVADMAEAIINGGDYRANGELALSCLRGNAWLS